MKKISIAILLTLSMGLVVAGCSGGDKAKEAEGGPSNFENAKPVPAEDGTGTKPATQ